MLYDESGKCHLYQASASPGATSTFMIILTRTPTRTPAPEEEYSFNLCSGLNLISLPFANNDPDTASKLPANFGPGNADAICVYDFEMKQFNPWTILDEGAGWETNPGMPFWVNITRDGDLSWFVTGNLVTSARFHLCSGLNMVALPA